MRETAERIVPVSLELGGKSPSIVIDAAEDETTIDGVIAAMRFTRQGQSCAAGSRLFVHEDIWEDFVERLTRRVDEMIVGDPLDERTDIGAPASRRRILRSSAGSNTCLAMAPARALP